MNSLLVFIIVLGWMSSPILAASKFCTNKYCEYIPGDPETNLLITAPHGGSLKPRSIPDRVGGCRIKGKCVYSHNRCKRPDTKRCPVSNIPDMYTKDMATRLADEYYKLTKVRPHVVVNHLHRGKLDPNRPKPEATFYNKYAKKAFDEFFGFIRDAKKRIGLQGDGAGLIVDLHGQAHPEGWNEIGYLVIKERLNGEKGKTVAKLRPLAKYSAIKSLAARVAKKKPSVSFEQLLRGSKSLGKYMNDQKRYYRVVPSPYIPKPGKGHYFKGGYITETCGSRYSGKIDALQIETHYNFRTPLTVRRAYVQDLAVALKNFMKHYD